ncbi:MAG: hypothetical protein OXG30_12945 [bacterium]|nr:hypothetical protein [bacterium]
MATLGLGIAVAAGAGAFSSDRVDVSAGAMNADEVVVHELWHQHQWDHNDRGPHNHPRDSHNHRTRQNHSHPAADEEHTHHGKWGDIRTHHDHSHPAADDGHHHHAGDGALTHSGAHHNAFIGHRLTHVQTLHTHGHSHSHNAVTTTHEHDGFGLHSSHPIANRAGHTGTHDHGDLGSHTHTYSNGSAGVSFTYPHTHNHNNYGTHTHLGSDNSHSHSHSGTGVHTHGSTGSITLPVTHAHDGHGTHTHGTGGGVELPVTHAHDGHGTHTHTSSNVTLPMTHTHATGAHAAHTHSDHNHDGAALHKHVSWTPKARTLAPVGGDPSGDTYTITVPQRPAEGQTLTVWIGVERAEVAGSVAVEPARLDITRANWDQTHTITVTASDDAQPGDWFVIRHWFSRGFSDPYIAAYERAGTLWSSIPRFDVTGRVFDPHDVLDSDDTYATDDTEASDDTYATDDTDATDSGGALGPGDNGREGGSLGGGATACATDDTDLLAKVRSKTQDQWNGGRPDLLETFTRAYRTMLGEDDYTVAQIKARPDRQTPNWQGSGPNTLWQAVYAELDRLQTCRN